MHANKPDRRSQPSQLAGGEGRCAGNRVPGGGHLSLGNAMLRGGCPPPFFLPKLCASECAKVDLMSSDEDIEGGQDASAFIEPLRKKRGRPRKDDALLVSPKPAEASHVVTQCYREGGKEWVEVAARERGKALSHEEKIGFLRCVAAVRHMAHHKKIMIKNAIGQFQCPQPVALAADMMSIGLCEAKAIHSVFQTSKMLPSGSGRGQHQRKLVIEEMFGASHLESWCRLIVMKCKATAKRPSYRDITIGLQELAASHAREELEAMGLEVEDEFFKTIGDTLSYQRVVRWCHRHRWLFSKITKRKGIVEDASEMQAIYAVYFIDT
jgi:hypothetical protein